MALQVFTKCDALDGLDVRVVNFGDFNNLCLLYRVNGKERVLGVVRDGIDEFHDSHGLR